MKAMIKSVMLWRFLGGFALGGLGVLTLHPASADTGSAAAPSAIASAQR